MSKLKCLFVSSEVVPYAKTGGLADVAGALPKELLKYDLDVRVVMPYYKTIADKVNVDNLNLYYKINLGWREQWADIFYKNDDVPVYFIKNDYYYNRDNLYGYGDDCERFAFFCRAVVALEFPYLFTLHMYVSMCVPVGYGNLTFMSLRRTDEDNKTEAQPC